MLSTVPEDTRIVVVAPRPDRTLPRLTKELAAASKIWPNLAPKRLGLLLTTSLGANISSARGLSQIGVDPSRPLLFIPRLPGAEGQLQAGLLIVGLRDRRRFDAWLARIAGPERRSVDLGKVRVRVLFPDSEEPIACLLRWHSVICQLGAAPGSDPMKLLRRVSEQRFTPMSNDALALGALSALDPDADFYVIARPARFAETLQHRVVERALRAHRFEEPSARKRRAKRVQREAASLTKSARSVQVVVGGVYLEEKSLRLDAEARLTASAASALRGALAQRSAPVVARWAKTPALGRFFVQMNPKLLAAGLEKWGLPLPAARLDGSLAVLALGIDTQCTAAKSSVRIDANVAPFLLPMAAAVGLSEPLKDDERAAIAESLGPKGAALPAQRAFGVLNKSKTGRLRGERFGAPIEVRFHPRALLVGSGAGGGDAAERRLGAGDPDGEPHAFVDIAIDPPAIAAAFETGDFDNVRPELTQAVETHRRLRPLLEQLRMVRLRSWANPPERSVRVELRAER